MIFASFWANFGSTLPLECYLYLSWGCCIYYFFLGFSVA